MENSKVWRQAYRRLRQAQLAVYAKNVVQRTKDNPTYTSLQPSILALDTLQQAFAQALAAAKDGGRDNTVSKDMLKAQLIVQLGAVADDVNDFAKGDPILIVNAGFNLPPESVRSSNQLPAPMVLRAISTGRPGELKVVLQDTFPNQVRQHGIEISEDGGQTFRNSSYDSRARFVLRDLPRASNLILRFSSLGRGNIRSGWSQAVTAAVL